MTRSNLFQLAAAVAVLASADVGRAQLEYEGTEIYVQGNFSQAFTRINSGGFNTFGPHPNTGVDDDDTQGLGISLGTVSDFEDFRIRLEAEGMARRNTDYRTNSFPGPPGPITFFYDVKVDDAWTAMANMWIDIPVNDILMLYGGGGIGVSGADLTVNDFVVVGNEDEVDFAFQLGGGVIVPLTDSVEFDLGYRYYDFGQPSIGIATPGAPTGGSQYKADLYSSEVMLSLRFLLP